MKLRVPVLGLLLAIAAFTSSQQIASSPVAIAQGSDRSCGALHNPNEQPNLSESLTLPVVFHLHRSQRWPTPDSLKGVLAETQRILSQANIALQPMFDSNDAGTEFLDVYFTPDVRVRGRSMNGVSFSWGEREVFVRDDVTLRKVADCRPTAPLELTSWKAVGGDRQSVRVSVEEAEQARTLAHEIAHQLGLPHRQDVINLQASGTTGWLLNQSEIVTMRQFAVQRFGAIAIQPENRPADRHTPKS